MHNHPPTGLLNSRSIPRGFPRVSLFLEKNSLAQPNYAPFTSSAFILQAKGKSVLLILTLCRWPDRWPPLPRSHWPSWCPPWIKRSSKQSEKLPTLRSMIIQSHIALHFRCSLRAVMVQEQPCHSTPFFQRWGQWKHPPQQATLLNDCHYSLSQLTLRSSSSDNGDSSEESPQSHKSSESVSQDVILAVFSCVPLQSSVYEQVCCLGQRRTM